MDTDNVVTVERGPDGDTVTVNGVLIPGASLEFSTGRRVVINIPVTKVSIRPTAATGPHVRRIALGDETYG